MKILLFSLLFAAPPAFAQTSPAEPKAALSEKDRIKMAIEELKVYTDAFRVPGGEPFPPPPPIAMFSAKDVDSTGFRDNNTQFWEYKKGISAYRERFFWDENDPVQPSEAHLDAERFQVAYGLASNRDPEAGARWVCGLAVALRRYFGFYNEAEGGAKGGWLANYTWGVGSAPVDKQQAINGEITRRYKEATGADLGGALNYATLERCVPAVQEVLAKNAPRPNKIPSLMKPPTPPDQAYFNDDLSDIDFEKYDYWVYYYDASWQPWGYIAAKTKWKPTAESLKQFILCRAPVWVGNYVSRAPKNGRSVSPYFPPKGSTTLRHRLQPEKAALRDRALIAEHQKKYCR